MRVAIVSAGSADYRELAEVTQPTRAAYAVPTWGAYGASALAALGQAAQFKEWMHRALLIDPENIKSRFNFACALVRLQDNDAALELLQPVFEKMAIGLLNHAKADPDLDPIRGHPKLEALVESAERRLAPQRTGLADDHLADVTL